MRLDKALAMSGMTRTEAKKAIAEGRVQVGGEVVRNSALHVQLGEVVLDGQRLDATNEVYYMVNKPQGVLTATEDSRGAKTVFDLLPEAVRRRKPGPVGRLDKDVTGLVIMTTDGQLAHRLISPKWSVEKIYLAEIEGDLSDFDMERLQGGVQLSDFTTLPARVRIVGPSMVELTITEGKFHQVKRMFGAVGHPVLTLKRLSVGGVELDEALELGQCRELSGEELARLRALVAMTEDKP